MLVKVTNKCGMGCSHCMEDSVPKGEHMTEETFLQALEFTKMAERSAWLKGCTPTILLSGGECTEHPDIVKFVETVVKQGFLTVLISNGLFLSNLELRESLLRPDWPILVQVTNDPRFYPTAPIVVNDPRITYIPTLTNMIPLGRFKKKTHSEVPTKQAPGSFNLRSLTHHLKSFEFAVATIRLRAAMGSSGNCIPSVSHEGYVMAGETRNCYKIGTVQSSNEELTKAILEMGSCNRCGLEDNLDQKHKRAIGISTLFAHNE